MPAAGVLDSRFRALQYDRCADRDLILEKMAKMDISYHESPDRLASRIRAHKLFGNIEIGDWIEAFLARRRRRNVFDLGCGDGNHIELYLRSVGATGTVTGLDRDAALIAQARERHMGVANLSLEVGSMDDKLPFADGAFDVCLANFSIYNAQDADFTLQELRRVLEPGGELVLIGPTPNNVMELYEFNQKVTGRRVDEKTRRRTERIVKEFLPLALRLFGRVQAEVIDSVLTFPNRDEFIRYFCATLLYEEIAEREGLSPDELKGYCPATGEIPVSKEMVAVVGTKQT
jgi:ubiquinone/menaquinone biosynthesis C-methylase UbiE